MKRAAEANPMAHFAVVDAVVDLPNVASLMFMEHEGSYLAGALAALKTKTNVIGFIGGWIFRSFGDLNWATRKEPGRLIPRSRLFLICGDFSGGLEQSYEGKELALAQIEQRADVIYHAAGASGLGVFDAVEERAGSKEIRRFLAVGVDSNQNAVKPGLVLTSMLKRVDVAVFETIRAAKANGIRRSARFWTAKWRN